MDSKMPYPTSSRPCFPAHHYGSDTRYRGPKPKRNWVSSNDAAARSLPIYAGGAFLLVVLFNRTVSDIALVADVSSQLSLTVHLEQILRSCLLGNSIRKREEAEVNPSTDDTFRRRHQRP
ncbi:hypothetical protein C1H46_041855 [Malus baccata]|uniref:Uncharacterized protein n=1 Tax=Malus baccata TaxID=106549 RepID=A0A540KEG4_MALBA|nr:hypothetical protein C1H46_041855 [Malus baccata]